MASRKNLQKGGRPKVVDLFCGAGGLSAGLSEAGFEVIGAVDDWKPACASIQANHSEAHVFCGDIRKLETEEFVSKLSVRPDLVVGGPSCQGFSTAGGFSRNGRKQDDDRNSLFLEFVRFVDALQPPWLLMENVPGLLLFNKGVVATEIIKQFRLIGYNVVPIILLAADYGVPQLRRRLFFVGNRVGSDVPLPLPSHGNANLWKNFALPFEHLSRIGNKSATSKIAPHVTFSQACSDLPRVKVGQTISGIPYPSTALSEFQEYAREGSSELTHHHAFELSEFDKAAIKHLKPGQNWTNLPDELKVGRFAKIRSYDATTLLKRLQLEKPSYTITTKFNEATTGAFIHPSQNRTLTIREAARLQSFKDKHVFLGSPSEVREQIGNAVPPLLAEQIGKRLFPFVMKTRGSKVKSEMVEGIDYVSFNPDQSPEDLIGLKGRKTTDSSQLNLL